jgi:2-oxoglutarate dehydrogenase E2 component (dihydrolipoamide succinyltransferase)
MSVSVSMPQLGESVTEGTVTRWLKKEGERVEADEPLLEVSTDKVDTEIPSPVSGILRGITVAEDETVAVGAELAVIDEEGSAGGAYQASGGVAAGGSPDAAGSAVLDGQGGSPVPAGSGSQAAAGGPANGAPSADQPAAAAQAQDAPAYPQQPYPPTQPPYEQPAYEQPAYEQPAYEQPAYEHPANPPAAGGAGYPQPAAAQAAPSQAAPPQAAPPQAAPPQAAPPQAAPPQAAPPQAAPSQAPPQGAPQQDAAYPAGPAEAGPAEAGPAEARTSPLTSGTDGPYVTPLVRKLAAEHGIDLGSVAGTGVGGRIRKQDVIDAARALRGPGTVTAPSQPAQAPVVAAAPTAPQAAAAAAPPAASQPAQAPAPAGRAAAVPAAAQGQAAGEEAGQAPARRPVIVPSSLRGTTEQMSRARQVIAKRMVESLQTSAQLTTVVEADVTAIARLRDRAKADFEAREGVKLSFLPFFALAAVEALKVHPRLNAVVDSASAQVTYHDAEHLGMAVDTDRGLMVPVIRKAGDLNIAGLARKIADLAQRTRAGRVSPDDLSGGTFTLTNTGSRGALFDTPIINQPQVAILGTGIVVKRPVVVEDAALGEVITVRSMVYLALTYDHRLVDGAEAAGFLVTMKSRLEEGAFETELGL